MNNIDTDVLIKMRIKAHAYTLFSDTQEHNMNNSDAEAFAKLRIKIHTQESEMKLYRPERNRFLYPFIGGLVSAGLAIATLVLITCIMIISNMHDWIADGIVAPLLIPLGIFAIVSIATIVYAFEPKVRRGYQNYLTRKMNYRASVDRLEFTEKEVQKIRAEQDAIEKEYQEHRKQAEAERIVKEFGAHSIVRE